MGFASETDSVFSSPRAESARAVTGRWCPHSGVGEDFLVRLPFFLSKLPELGNEKSTNRSQSAKWTVSSRATNGPLTKFGVAWVQIFGPRTEFSGPKRKPTSLLQACSSHDQEKLCKQKSTLFPNEYPSFSKSWVIFWRLDWIFGQIKTLFSQT